MSITDSRFTNKRENELCAMRGDSSHIECPVAMVGSLGTFFFLLETKAGLFFSHLETKAGLLAVGRTDARRKEDPENLVYESGSGVLDIFWSG